MKGILINSTMLAGKRYVYNDITKGITASCFPVDKFYGGRVTRFGKTAKGLLLCLEKNYEEVIDIFVDFDTLEGLDLKTLQAIATVVKDRKLTNTPGDQRDAMEAKLEIPKEATKKELAEYIRKYAVGIVSNEPELPQEPDKEEKQKEQQQEGQKKESGQRDSNDDQSDKDPD